MDKSLRTSFDQVDETTDPQDFVRYLDTTRGTEFFREIKRRSLSLLDLRPGDRVLDVGCGTGDEVIALAEMIGPSGLAVGADFSATMVAEGRQRATELGLPCVFLQSDVQHLPFPDCSFDGCRAERLLQHVPDADLALRELVRVARAGASIVIWEADLDTLVFDAPDRRTSRRIAHFICDGFRNGAIGHQLYRRLKDLGLEEVQAEPRIRAMTEFWLMETAFDLRASAQKAADAGLVTPTEAADWIASLETAAANDTFFAAVSGFLVSGKKG
ncbi:MAG: methyltransferase domain-containing protein [Thermomicrobiales bacterium]